MTITLNEIAIQIGGKVQGDGGIAITGLATLMAANTGDLSFLANMAYKDQLQSTQASAVILHPEQAKGYAGSAILMDNPYLGYAKASMMFDSLPKPSGLIDSTACIDESANIGVNVSIGANAVIGKHVNLGDNTIIAAGCVIGEHTRIGSGTRLHANVSVYHGCVIGNDCIIHSGAVIGSDGFGFAPDQGNWVKIAQIGGVVIGNNVEIGANTTIDRGALSDTQIGNGVKIDNQVQVAHNVVIGDHSAIAGGTGIAGSTTIGKHCTLAGAVGVVGHLTITDHVHVTGMTLVSKSITKPGSYSSGTALSTSDEWRRNAVRFRRLDDMAKRIQRLEKAKKE